MEEPILKRADSSRLIHTPPVAVVIRGRLLADVRRFFSGCSVLLEMYLIDVLWLEGRTKLELPDCS